MELGAPRRNLHLTGLSSKPGTFTSGVSLALKREGNLLAFEVCVPKNPKTPQFCTDFENQIHPCKKQVHSHLHWRVQPGILRGVTETHTPNAPANGEDMWKLVDS